ncbi:MAG: NYN domain-containing protein [Pseudonocardiaceae bacterium]
MNPAQALTDPTTLLVWDAPNIDMALGSILGGRPSSASRPRFDALGRWLLGHAGVDTAPEATVFTNVSPGSTDFVRPWVEALRNTGFAVFAKPKIDDSDIDDDMLAHIRSRVDQGVLRQVVVASGDSRAFREPLEDLVAGGVTVTVLGFREHASFAVNSEVLEFLDLEDIEGLFLQPLPRITLESLPPEGAWLAPLRPLSSLLRHQPVPTPEPPA